MLSFVILLSTTATFMTLSQSVFVHAQSSHFGGGSGSGCALVLSSTSANHGGFNGKKEVCITYADVDAAFDYAISATGGGIPAVTAPRYQNEDIENIAKVVTEMTRFLAKEYSLDKETISEGLALLETTKTKLHAYCPNFLVSFKCDSQRYRTMSGFCNNIKNPHWGAAMTAQSDFLTPDYADGVSAIRASSQYSNSIYPSSGYSNANALPNPRLISSYVHMDSGFHDHAVTMLLVAWGQFVDHDMILAAETKDRYTRKTPRCCDSHSAAPAHPNCLPIEIPAYDKFYARYHQRCMNFARNLAGLRSNCRLGPRQPLNTLSSFIDGGPIYSNTEEKMESLRMYENGKMKSLDAFETRGHHLLPLKLEEPNEGCIRPSSDVYCFSAGDARVNEQTVLAVVHTIMMREHNRLCDELHKINPHWSDETLFQESRHILVAMMQHITYNEFLPMVLGKKVMEQYELVLGQKGHVNKYDPYINPTIATSFSSAAFRFGHTLLPSTIERWSKSHQYIGSQRLSEMLQQPYDLYKEGWMDSYVLGMANQVAQAYDDSVTAEVTNHLFQEPNKHFGLDLAAINIQRAREQGVPSYNEWRKFCNLPIVHTWYDLYGIMSNKTVTAFSQLYATPDDLDLWSAGISEVPHSGSMVGPTLGCIIGKQFHNLRFGDRFWYENGQSKVSSFTVEQLQEIRKIRLSRVICDNTDDIETIQAYSMVLPDHQINERVACRNQVLLPSIDLSKWLDITYAPAHHKAPVSAPLVSSYPNQSPFQYYFNLKK